MAFFYNNGKTEPQDGDCEVQSLWKINYLMWLLLGSPPPSGGGSSPSAAIQSGPLRGPVLDASGSITTGGVSRLVLDANPNRNYVEVQNISTGDLYVNYGAAATIESNSFKIEPGESHSLEAGFVSTDSVNIIGATTGQKYVCKHSVSS